MLTRHFVGLTFYSDNLLSRKIDGFKRRFDPKYAKHQTLHLTLLAPFEINVFEKKSLKEQLVEEMDSFFFEREFAPAISFNGMDIYQHGKNNILYMNPHFDEDMTYLMEAVREVCESFIPHGVKYKRNIKQFLPIGKFQDMDQLLGIMQKAHDEFDCNGQLFVESICLFEEKYGLWTIEEELIKFDPPKDHLLNSSMALL